jgi:protein subunit release factor B
MLCTTVVVSHSYKLVEEEAGEQAGIKSCRIDAEGPLCYGLLAGEKVGRILFLVCSALLRTVSHIQILILQTAESSL